MKALLAVVVLSFGSLGCASKGYVGHQMGDINRKVTALSGDVEQTQERTRRNEARIDEVDKSAQSGVAAARGSAAEALDRATEAQRAARGKLLYTLTLSTDKARFGFDKASMSDDAKRVVAEALAPVIADNRGAYIEIEGHTDATGPEAYNKRLGEARAVAVRDYLHDQLGIALNRMAVISYGSSRPLVDNATPSNRASNRRVVVNVIE